jgi:hypothetical protein
MALVVLTNEEKEERTLVGGPHLPGQKYWSSLKVGPAPSDMDEDHPIPMSLFSWQSIPQKAYGKLITRQGKFNLALDTFLDQTPKIGDSVGLYRTNLPGEGDVDPPNRARQRFVLLQTTRGSGFRIRMAAKPRLWVSLHADGLILSAQKSEALVFQFRYVCVVCYEEFHTPSVYDQGGELLHHHQVCESCMSSLKKIPGGKECPTCREPIVPAKRQQLLLNNVLGELTLRGKWPAHHLKELLDASDSPLDLRDNFNELGRGRQAEVLAAMVQSACFDKEPRSCQFLNQIGRSRARSQLAYFTRNSHFYSPTPLSDCKNLTATLSELLVPDEDVIFGDDLLVDYFGSGDGAPPHAAWEIQADTTTIRSGDGRFEYTIGTTETPLLGELRASVHEQEHKTDGTVRLKVTIELGVDVGKWIQTHNGAVVQAASQANGLEHPDKETTLEAGLAGYLGDQTQGPSVALTTLPTTYDRLTRSQRHFNALDQFNVPSEIDPTAPAYLQNGYVMVKDLYAFHRTFWDHEHPRDQVRLMLIKDAPVTGYRSGLNMYSPSADSSVTISQVFNFAIATNAENQIVADKKTHTTTFTMKEGRSMGIQYELLYAAYESVILFAMLTKAKGPIALTQVGAGAFGVSPAFVWEVIADVLRAYEQYDLDVHILVYSRKQPSENTLKLLGGRKGASAITIVPAEPLHIKSAVWERKRKRRRGGNDGGDEMKDDDDDDMEIAAARRARRHRLSGMPG